jgi:hypothetical protein
LAVRTVNGSYPDWRDAGPYAPLLEADRSLIAWEWLRRDPSYQSAARGSARAAEPASEAARFGLVEFEPAEISVPNARPIWRSDVHPFVLPVDPVLLESDIDCFDPCQLRGLERIVSSNDEEHLLLCDGLRSIRLDAPAGTFGKGPVALRYSLGSLALAEPQILTLRRLLALYRSGRFSRVLHPAEPRARRWVLMLRAWDALVAGADQRRIAEALLSRSAGEPFWRNREPSVRSQVQRLVRSARAFGQGGYRALLG